MLPSSRTSFGRARALPRFAALATAMGSRSYLPRALSGGFNGADHRDGARGYFGPGGYGAGARGSGGPDGGGHFGGGAHGGAGAYWGGPGGSYGFATGSPEGAGELGSF